MDKTRMKTRKNVAVSQARRTVGPFLDIFERDVSGTSGENMGA